MLATLLLLARVGPDPWAAQKASASRSQSTSTSTASTVSVRTASTKSTSMGMSTASTGSPLHDFTSSTRRVQDEMTPLVARLGSSSARSQELAAIELYDLVGESNGADSRAAIVRAGAIEPLVALARSGSERAQEAAAGALSYLATDHQAAIAQAGA